MQCPEPGCDFVPRTGKLKGLQEHHRLIHERAAIDVRQPVTADDPAVWTGANAVAPMDLPKNLATTIPAPFPFAWVAIWHHPAPLVLFMSLTIITAFEYVYIGKHLPWLWSILTPIILISATIVLPAKIAPGMAVRTAIIIRKTPEGVTEVDGAKWWWHDAAKWSDAWRWVFETKGRVRRFIIIDAQEYDFATPDKSALHPFTPWLAPLPVRPSGLDDSVPFHAPSQTELGMIYAKGKALRDWLDVRDPTAQLINQMTLGILIGVAFLAIYLGGDRVASFMKQRDVANAAATTKAAVQSQVQAELLNLLQTGQLLPTTPTPAPTK